MVALASRESSSAEQQPQLDLELDSGAHVHVDLNTEAPPATAPVAASPPHDSLVTVRLSPATLAVDTTTSALQPAPNNSPLLKEGTTVTAASGLETLPKETRSGNDHSDGDASTADEETDYTEDEEVDWDELQKSEDMQTVNDEPGDNHVCLSIFYLPFYFPYLTYGVHGTPNFFFPFNFCS